MNRFIFSLNLFAGFFAVTLMSRHLIRLIGSPDWNASWLAVILFAAIALINFAIAYPGDGK